MENLALMDLLKVIFRETDSSRCDIHLYCLHHRVGSLLPYTLVLTPERRLSPASETEPILGDYVDCIRML